MRKAGCDFNFFNFIILQVMPHYQKTGEAGEKMAVEYLSNCVFLILHQNWRLGYWEVDIIASRYGTLHFFEVKTRRAIKLGYPEEDVTKKKVTNLIYASEEFLNLYPEWKRIQFDFLSVNLNKSEPPQFFFIEDVHK